MEEEDEFIPNLDSMLEVSLVEDTSSTVTFTVEGDPKCPSKVNLTDVPCPPLHEQDQGSACPESPSKTNSTDVQCLHENALDTDLLDFGHRELLMSESLSMSVIDEEEKQLYYSFFKDVKMVMNLRLHCTVCDCHIGCTPTATFSMSFHRILRVLVCKECEIFYGNGDFPCGDDGSETFCCWCGQGGQLYCCSLCPSVFCKKCIRRNLGKKTVQMIEESSDWTCFRCNIRPIWEHRALCWGLSTFLKEQSKAEKKIPADVAEKSPGSNPNLCCQGEKHAYFRAGQPLKRLRIPSAARDTLKVKDIQTLKLPSNEMNILHNALTSCEKIPQITSSSFTKTISDVHNNGKVDPVSNFSHPSSVVTSQPPSNENKFIEQFISENKSNKSPYSDNVSKSVLKISDPKTPVKPSDGMTNSTLQVFQKQPQFTYESAFVRHLAQASLQNQTLHLNQRSRQNCILPKKGCPNITVPLSYVQGPSGTIMVSSRSNSITGPTVNKVFINQKDSSNIIYTMPGSNISAAQHIQHKVPPVPTTYYLINSNPNEIPKADPISSFHKPSFSSPGYIHLIPPPSCQKMVVHKNVENPVSVTGVQTTENEIFIDDDDDVEIISHFQNANDALKTECAWMMEALKKTDHASKLLAYHVEILRQKFVSEVKGKEASTKSIRHLAGKCNRLLIKASKRLNLQREFVAREFSDWLKAERAKHGIPGTKEIGTSTLSSKGKTSEAETNQEPELLLDMEISCESDHEDVSSLNSDVKEPLNESNENLSECDSESDDPFSDSEDMECKRIHPGFKPFYSHTVREVLRDKFVSKMLLQLLTEQQSKIANKRIKTQNGKVSSSKEFQSSDVSTQDIHKEEEELNIEEKESNRKSTPEWSCAFTEFLAIKESEQISGTLLSTTSNSPLHPIDIANHINVSGNEKHVRTKSDPNNKAIHNTKSSSSSLGDKIGNERSERCPTPSMDSSVGSIQKSNADSENEMQVMTKPVDPKSQTIQNIESESYSGKIEDKTGGNKVMTKPVDSNIQTIQNIESESYSGEIEDKTGRNKIMTKPVDPNIQTIQNIESESYSGKIEEKTAGNKTNERCLTPGTDSSIDSIQKSKADRENEMHVKTEPVDPNSQTTRNIESESFYSRIESKLVNKGSESCPPSCMDSRIYSAQKTEADTKTSIIEMRGNTPIQSGSVSGDSNLPVAKRKHLCIESPSDMTLDMQTNHSTSCVSQETVAKKVRKYSPCSRSSSSSVMLPILERFGVDGQIPVNDFTALTNFALQKKLIKPCSVSILNLN